MEPAIVIGLLIIAVVLFATEKISVDLVTLGLLCVLVLTGTLSVSEAFAGFGNEVIVMLGAIFVIGAALRETGILDMLGNLLSRRIGNQPPTITTGLMTGVAAISAFMNNTTVVAMFLGPVIGLARRLRLPASRLLMPLAFASILGGTCTLIGTSTNVAVSGALKKMGMPEIGMFELLPIGLVILVAGILYMTFVGQHLVPVRDRADSDSDLPIREYMAEIVVLAGSPLIGQKPYESDFSVLEFQVLKVRRGGEEVGMGPVFTLQEGDVVLIAGKVQNLIKIKKIEGIDIKADVSLRQSGAETNDQVSLAEVVLTPRSSLVGQTLRHSNFRRRSGLSVLALLRGDRTLNDKMADVALAAGDLLLVQGSYDRLRTFEENSEMVVITEHEFSPSTKRRGIAVFVIFALAVLASGFGLAPPAITFLLAALAALALRSITLDMAYENIDWRLLILIGGMTSFGTAMVNSGADKVLAESISGSLQPLGAHGVLAGFCLLTVLLTQPMSNAAAALVVLPIAVQAALALGVNPRSFGIGVMLSASVSVLTPFEPSCILVFGPGKYRFGDFIKVGGGLTVAALAIIVFLVPVIWPLK
ncbi:MAG TPA: SLC13 family permease [Prosthecobacter sp.]|nr:SLC13 family permease [Prosthecobacter sp.]